MARARKSSSAPKKAAAQSARRRIRPLRWLLKWVLRAVMLVAALTVLWVLLYKVVNPPTTIFMMQEGGASENPASTAGSLPTTSRR